MSYFSGLKMLIVDQEKALRQSHIKQSVLSLKKTNVCENFFNQWNFDFGIATYFIFVTIEQSFSVPIDKIGSWQWVTDTIGICRFLQFEIFYVGYRARISFHCFVLSCKCVTLHTLFTSIVCVCICVCTWKCLSQTLWICVCGSCKNRFVDLRLWKLNFVCGAHHCDFHPVFCMDLMGYRLFRLNAFSADRFWVLSVGRAGLFGSLGGPIVVVVPFGRRDFYCFISY